MNKLQNLLSLKQPSSRKAAIVAIAVAPLAARADGTTFDVSTIVSTLTAAGVACASVGIAYMTVIVGIKTYKLIRQSF